MPLLVMWFGLMVGAAIVYRMSRSFRTGKDPRKLALYRDARKSALTRNFALIGVATGWLVAPAGVIGLAIIVEQGSLSRPALGGAFVVFLGYALLVINVLQILAYRPPTWLIPTWLQEDDRRMGWLPPSPNGADLVQLAINVALALGALGMIVLGCISILRQPLH